jgi:hypothetical protein
MAGKRDEGRLAIAMLLGLWLTFFALASVLSVASAVKAGSAGMVAVYAACFLVNLNMVGRGVKWTVLFVTGRDCDDEAAPESRECWTVFTADCAPYLTVDTQAKAEEIARRIGGWVGSGRRG